MFGKLLDSAFNNSTQLSEFFYITFCKEIQNILLIKLVLYIINERENSWRISKVVHWRALKLLNKYLSSIFLVKNVYENIALLFHVP